LLQLAVPLGGSVQTVPQLPQLDLWLFRFTHALPHLEYGELQLKPQLPALQVAVPFGGAWQPFEQLPQCCGSVCRLTQVPLQFAVPCGQLRVQVPFAQTSLTPH
jgi:hypothetical protein